MTGNVSEWVGDLPMTASPTSLFPAPFAGSYTEDPLGTGSWSTLRVARGGDFRSTPTRVSYRYLASAYSGDLGFRLVRTIE